MLRAMQPNVPLALAALATCAVPFLASAANSAADCESAGSCPVPGRALLQKTHRARAELDESTVSEDNAGVSPVTGRSRAEDARFLTHATFGPSAEGLEELRERSYKDWIAWQTRLPASTHRDWYRKRVNPRFSQVRRRAVYSDRYRNTEPCMQKARYVDYAFDVWDHWVRRAHSGRVVEITETEIKVDGRLRTKLKPGWLANTSLAGHTPFRGHVCGVEEGVGGKLVVAVPHHCQLKSQRTLTNPPIYMPGALKVSGKLTAVRGSPAVVLESDEEDLCDRLRPGSNHTHNKRGENVYIEVNGKHLRFDHRFMLLGNSRTEPVDWKSWECVDMNPVNRGGGCKILKEGCVSDRYRRVAVRSRVSCGSPGELASVPELGHHASMELDDWSCNAFCDKSTTDGKYQDTELRGTDKGMVWTMRALQAPDQLRQRMAWALSQIYTVTCAGSRSEHCLAYYDIFVRNGLGNLRDIIKEVTYSPLMGAYLNSHNSQSSDRTKRFPNENYAREIMQLFSIGTQLLNEDGTVKRGEDGEPLNSFSETALMSYARAFTGFLFQHHRLNYERAGTRNYIDPMRQEWWTHDDHPKTDLLGGYIGDGLPLCSELPAKAHMAKGAKYKFVDISVDRKRAATIPLGTSSALKEALCPGGTCESALVELASDLRCDGQECDREAAQAPLVQVDERHVFWYVRPPCVGLHFEKGDELAINEDGKAFTRNGVTTWDPVLLEGQKPRPGTHAVESVAMERVFEKLPTKEAALASLSIGAWRPTGACSYGCGGDVKAYSDGGFTTSTVFEVDGKFFKNARSVLSVGGGKVRNPPAFANKKSHFKLEREDQAVNEVESAIDSIFRHPNCPIFISKLLIQRFVSSNPSPAYVRAVAAAFRSGSHEGVAYGGKYGDLAATAAALLLHPEARTLDPEGTRTTVNGLMREPMLKITHYLRAMGYRDSEDGEIVMRNLLEVVGQFPHQARTVFSYFTATYELPRVAVMPPGEPEPEPEPQSPLLAPEFEINTPKHVVGYLNGMLSLVQRGVTGGCGAYGAFGIQALKYWNKNPKSRVDVCPQGTFTFNSKSWTKEQALEELDILLTGGRLSPRSKEIMGIAYDKEATPEKALEGAQKAAVMTAEFNTLGASLPFEGKRQPYEKKAGSGRPYKALVMIFLYGGADTWNLLVPQNCALYDDYTKKRTDLSLRPNELKRISAKGQGQPCEEFGVHSRFGLLQELYDKKQAAFVSNIGHMDSGKGHRPYLGHPTMQGKGQSVGGPNGAGGRIADALGSGSEPFVTSSFSMKGAAPWSLGAKTDRKIVAGGGTLKFAEAEKFAETVGNITAQHHGNKYAEIFAEQLQDGLGTVQHLSETLSGAKLKKPWTSKNYMGVQLEVVARLIAEREKRRAERDFFFVDGWGVVAGGWDHHHSMKARSSYGYGAVDNALRSFVQEMEAQGAWGSVAVTMQSDFARTLTSNGGGSDHAWAGQTFVLGGGLKGGRILGKFPKSFTNSPRETDRDGRGRLMPEHPWESLMLPLAKWLGVTEKQYPEVFPALPRFNASHLIPDLFP